MCLFSGFVSDTKNKILIIKTPPEAGPMMCLWSTMVKQETGYVLQPLNKK